MKKAPAKKKTAAKKAPGKKRAPAKTISADVLAQAYSLTKRGQSKDAVKILMKEGGLTENRAMKEVSKLQAA